MGIWLGPMGNNIITEADFTYDGDYLFTSDGRNWEMALLTGSASSLVFFKNPGNVDMTIVAGGQTARQYAGEQPSAYNGPSYGSYGGNGGGVVPVRGVQLSANTNYAVTIGASDNNSSVIGGGVSYTAVSGNGSSGGDGAIVQNSITEPSPGADGVYAYGEESDTLMFTEAEFPGHLFGPGGSGGGAHCGSTSKWSQGALGGESNGPNHEYGKGGRYLSGYPSLANGADGYANHGQGGGGAAYWWTGSVSRYGDGSGNVQGKGGSGVVFIRNAS